MKRIFLLAGAIGWGVSILGVLLPWSVMDIVLQNMGATTPIRQPRTPQNNVPSPGQMAVPIAAPA